MTADDEAGARTTVARASRSTRVVVATNAAPTTNDTIVMATLIQLALGAFVEIE